MQNERIDVWPKLGHDERDALRHQTRDKRHITAEPVELGDHNWALEFARFVQGYAQLRAQFESVHALACLYLDMLASERELLGLSEASDCLALSIEAEARAASPSRSRRAGRRSFLTF